MRVSPRRAEGFLQNDKTNAEQPAEWMGSYSMTNKWVGILLLAFIIHRWGLIVGIVGGALYGLSLYLINYLTFSAFFPWFYPLQSWMMVVGHVFFGALAGGLYEALERDIYVEVDTPAVEESSSA